MEQLEDEKIVHEAEQTEHIEQEQTEKTKYVILIGDGMADHPVESIGGKTALEAARIPFINKLCAMGELGAVTTVPHHLPPASDVANMSLFGYDPAEYYTGRGAIEAAAMGIPMNPEDVAFRCNLVTLTLKDNRIFMKDYSAGHISTEEGAEIMKTLSKEIQNRSFSLYPGVSYRHILLWRGGPEGISTIPPHDVTGQDVTEAWRLYEEEPVLNDFLNNAVDILHRHPVNQKRKAEGKAVANSLWPWGQGRKPFMPPIEQEYGIKGAVIAAVDLIKGLAKLTGMTIINVDGATGYLDTNYKGKGLAALEALKDHDLVIVHVEAPDEAGHMGDIKEKIRAIEQFDREVVGTVFNGLNETYSDFRLMVTTDHFTPVALKTHAQGNVPFVIYDKVNPKDNLGSRFTEKTASQAKIQIKPGHKLMERFIGKKQATD